MEVLKILNPSNEIIQKNTDSGLQLSKITVNVEYAKKWNVGLNDFLCLTKNGELISNNLYRVGGMGTPNLEKDNYFMLLKYVEAYYDDEITKDKSRKPHLDGLWCIIDKNGIEKVECKKFSSPYLVKNSCIYSIDRKYYNIENGQLYCQAYTSVESKDFLFLENSFDDDKSKRGVMKINKKDGSCELFPE